MPVPMEYRCASKDFDALLADIRDTLRTSVVSRLHRENVEAVHTSAIHELAVKSARA